MADGSGEAPVSGADAGTVTGIKRDREEIDVVGDGDGGGTAVAGTAGGATNADGAEPAAKKARVDGAAPASASKPRASTADADDTSSESSKEINVNAPELDFGSDDENDPNQHPGKINYRRRAGFLLPPGSTQVTSMAWHFAGFGKHEDGSANTDFAVCCVPGCKKILKYNRQISTGYIIAHVRRQHKDLKELYSQAHDEVPKMLQNPFLETRERRGPGRPARKPLTREALQPLVRNALRELAELEQKQLVETVVRESGLAMDDTQIAPPDELVSVRVFVERDGYELNDTFLWPVSARSEAERTQFAAALVADLKLPKSFEADVQRAIKDQVQQHQPPVADVRDTVFDVRLSVAIDNTVLKDQFSWDVSNPDNDPAAFAQTLCDDLGLGSEFAVAAAQEIAMQVNAYRRAVATIAAHNATVAASDHRPIPSLEIPQTPFRDSKSLEEWTPQIRTLDDDDDDAMSASERAREQDMERERRRMRRSSVLAFGSGLRSAGGRVLRESRRRSYRTRDSF